MPATIQLIDQPPLQPDANSALNYVLWPRNVDKLGGKANILYVRVLHYYFLLESIV